MRKPTAMLLLAIVLGAGLAGAGWYGHDRAHRRDVAVRQSLAAAPAAAQAIFSYDYRSFDASVANGKGFATGGFADEYAQTTTALKSNAIAEQAIVRASVSATGVVRKKPTRYNPGGGAIDAAFRLPAAPGSVDLAYLYSVFSHLPEAHLRVYLGELARVLAPGGRVFLTAFVEEGVPPVVVNPPGYAFERCSGPLHVVRYERGHFAGLLEAAGFRVDRFDHGAETDGQSGVYLALEPAGGPIPTT